MLPAFLITFREVIEACLIIATVLGILSKLHHPKSIRTTWLATASAGITVVALLFVTSFFGLEMQKLYTGRLEQITEGFLLIISAIFITWAVFFLHKYFSNYKVKLLQKVKTTIESQEQKGIFILVFTAVLREGIEIVLFLSTIYFSTSPGSIFSGFFMGIIGGVALSFALFSATLKLPLFYAFKFTSALLILFAGGMLAKGIHEFIEFGILPETAKITLPLIPSSSVAGGMVQTIFGISKHMEITQLMLYVSYVVFMAWWVFIRKQKIA